jgi:hypothetical protein
VPCAKNPNNGVGQPDLVESRPAVLSVEAELATFNVKHYNVLKELKTIQSYEK